MARLALALPLALGALALLAATAAAFPLSDLVVEHISLEPGNPRAGDRVAFSAEVRNQARYGNVNYTSFEVAFSVDGVPLGNATVAELDAGESVTVTAPAAWLAATEGNHSILVEADPPHADDDEDYVPGQVQELDEDNNTLIRAFEVVAQAAPPMPDLEVLEVQAPVDLIEGQPANVTARVKNVGSSEAGPFRVDFAVDADAVGVQDVPGLAPGASVVVASPPWTSSGAGLRRARAIADAAAQVQESNEDNNEGGRRFLVRPAGPDLVAVQLTATPANPRLGEDVTLGTLLQNQGTRDAGPFQVEFRADDAVVANVTAPGLAAGASLELEARGWAPAHEGARTLEVRVDAAGSVSEADELNNARFQLVQVGEPRAVVDQPDLLILRLHVTPEHPVPGDAARLWVEVANAGRRMPLNFTVRFFMESFPIGEGHGEMGPSESRATVEGPPWRSTVGSWTLRALVDAGNAIAERDEQNNLIERSVLVTSSEEGGAAADLVALSLEPDLAEPRAGETTGFLLRLVNRGRTDAGGFFVRFYVDEQVLGEEVEVQGLASGASAEVASPRWVAVPGNHSAEAVADTNGRVQEGDEFNNNARATFTVAPGGGTSTPAPGPVAVLFAVAAALLLARRRRG